MTSSSKDVNKIEVLLNLGPNPELTRSASPHEEFVNLRSEVKALRMFETRWGPLFKPTKYDNPEAENRIIEKFETEMNELLAAGALDIRLAYRDKLREAWKTDPQWLSKVPVPDVSDESEFDAFPRALLDIYWDVEKRMAYSNWRFRNGRIETTPEDLWASICLLFLRDHTDGRTGICANPQCPNPYFIKKRSTQKYCEAGPCVGYAQRQYALHWWNTEGKKRRQKEQSKAQNKRRKSR
jgi:hypothetical protein